MEQIIYCPTKEDSIKAQEKFFKEGIYWIGGDKKINKRIWDIYEEKTCISCNGKFLTYADIDYYKENYPNIQITQAKEFLKEK